MSSVTEKSVHYRQKTCAETEDVVQAPTAWCPVRNVPVEEFFGDDWGSYRLTDEGRMVADAVILQAIQDAERSYKDGLFTGGIGAIVLAGLGAIAGWAWAVIHS